MKSAITIIIDGKKIKAKKDATILEAAKINKIKIPSLCWHSDLMARESCRICVVKIKGKKGFFPACSTKVESKMEIITDSPGLNKARKINLELIFAQHREECNDCVWSFDCRLLALAKKYKVDLRRFVDRKRDYPVYKFGPSLEFDSTKCIDCRNCVEVCDNQGIGFLEVKDKGAFLKVIPSKDPKKDCIYCGQCITHCPAGAFEAVGEFEDIKKPLIQKDKIIVFQFAPSIRSSIGEEFNMEPGSIVTGKLVSAIRKLGANKVFDVSAGADFTTVEEAKELIERISQKKGLPLFTSCCPAWVKFVEFYKPEFIPNLTSVRSPHIISGGLIKTYWAEKQGIDPKKIIVVSVMPCVSKKYEIQRKELRIGPLKPVDYVLTTREMAYLLIKNNIDLSKMPDQEPDSPLGFPSGAGIIYGASGGVMESAIRTAQEIITGKKLSKIDFKKARGQKGIKKAVLKIGKKNLKIAVVNGIRNVKIILEQLKKNPKMYDYVEVMACPGGCIGGGGQPLPSDSEIREKRAVALYNIDKKKEIRLAHKNPVIEEVYQSFLDNNKIISNICHTEYSRKKREVGF